MSLECVLGCSASLVCDVPLYSCLGVPTSLCPCLYYYFPFRLLSVSSLLLANIGLGMLCLICLALLATCVVLVLLSSACVVLVLLSSACVVLVLLSSALGCRMLFACCSWLPHVVCMLFLVVACCFGYLRGYMLRCDCLSFVVVLIMVDVVTMVVSMP